MIARGGVGVPEWGGLGLRESPQRLAFEPTFSLCYSPSSLCYRSINAPKGGADGQSGKISYLC